MKCDWQGVFPAAVTHFHDDHSVNLDATITHLHQMIEGGIHGVVMLGTVGENCSLLYEEKLDVLRETVNAVDGKIPVLTGVAEYTTALACRFSQDAEKLGVDGLMVLPGMVYPSDTRETVTHFEAVAKSVGLPIMCYNNPHSYGVDIKPEVFLRMAEVENLVCIKESSGDPRRITDLVNVCGDRYVLFCGVDDLAYESVLLGAVGWVSGLVNAFPKENRAIWDALMAGEHQKALEIYRWYTPLLHLDTHHKLVQYIKMCVQECGYGSELTRPPRLTVVGEEREAVLKIIRDAIATRPQL